MKRALILTLLAVSAFAQPRPAAPPIWRGRGTTLPPTCTANRELFWKSDATPGQNVYGCTATNTWTAQAGGGGGVTGLSVDADNTVKASVSLTMPAPSTPTYTAGGTTTCNLATSNYCAPTAIATSGTTLALTNPHGSGPYWITWTQPSSSPVANPITYPGTMANCPQPSPTASKITTFQFVWTGTAYRCLGSDDALDTPLTTGTFKLSCDMAFGDTSGSALTNGQLGPQIGVCFIPMAATVLEVDVRADAGTPSIIVGVRHAGSVANLTSSALATGSSGARACSKTSAVAGIDGTTCSATLQNTSVAAGDYLEAVSGTAGGTAKWMTAHIVYSLN